VVNFSACTQAFQTLTNSLGILRSEFVLAVDTKFRVLRTVSQCRFVVRFQRFTPKVEEAGFSRKLKRFIEVHKML
jgi:hypothetical protein